MPSARLPQVGETWSHRGIGVEGIVCSARGTLITFVGATGGNRISYQFDRGRNEIALDPWTLKSPPPRWSQSCSQEQCVNGAFIHYYRPPKGTSEVVCPKHIPRGLRAVALQQPLLPTTFFEGSQCLSCGEDGVEVFGALSWNQQHHDSAWCCSWCPEQWLLVSWAGFTQDFKDNEATQHCTGGVTFLSIVGQERRLAPGVTYRVRVRMDPTKKWEEVGVKAATLYDHIKNSEFEL